MIIKILAIADLLAIIALLGSSLLPQNIIILMGLYLIIKGLVFTLLFGNLFPSSFDILSGFYIVFVAFSISHWIITTLIILFLGQKAFFSLV